MTKQVLEIEVPDGKKAVWRGGRVVFIDVDAMKRIKTVGDATQFLSNKGICEDILDSLSRLPENSFEWKVAAYRAVVAAVTYDEPRYLISGERWYPTIEFCRPGRLNNCHGDTIIGRIKSEGAEFDVVGGDADLGTYAGLGAFYSAAGVGGSSAHFGICSVGLKEAALYISKQFGKLLFEISYGGMNCDWEWIK